MVVLLTTPFFNNLGGTELETIHTANVVAEQNSVKSVLIFVHGNLDIHFLSNISLNKKIRIITYPFWYKYHKVGKLQKNISILFKSELFFFENVYWKIFFFKKIDSVYIITKSTLNYYYPIVNNYKSKKRILIKFTTIFYENFSIYKKNTLKKCLLNIVTSGKQESFFKHHLNIKNTVTQEVLVYNEAVIVDQKKNRGKSKFDFGVITRFSQEKQLEDAIEVISLLNDMGHHKTLIIKGDGKKSYYEFLKTIIKFKNLENQVFLKFAAVPYDKVYKTFEDFDCFLLTSKFEGGPNIAIELMAYGLPIISYKVGAMEDRLNNFPQLIANDIQEMTSKALSVITLEENEYQKLSKSLKEDYVRKRSNSNKVDFLMEKLLGQ